MYQGAKLISLLIVVTTYGGGGDSVVTLKNAIMHLRSHIELATEEEKHAKVIMRQFILPPLRSDGVTE
jgi:hypothetical protein